MATKSKTRGLMVVALLALLALFLMRKKPPGGGAVSPSGSIGTVDVAQAILRQMNR